VHPDSRADEPDANRNPFGRVGVGVLGGIAVGILRGEKESSSPHSRLCYVHLRCLQSRLPIVAVAALNPTKPES
jgi:hypothetical protein